MAGAGGSTGLYDQAVEWHFFGSYDISMKPKKYIFIHTYICTYIHFLFRGYSTA